MFLSVPGGTTIFGGPSTDWQLFGAGANGEPPPGRLPPEDEEEECDCENAESNWVRSFDEPVPADTKDAGGGTYPVPEDPPPPTNENEPKPVPPALWPSPAPALLRPPPMGAFPGFTELPP